MFGLLKNLFGKKSPEPEKDDGARASSPPPRGAPAPAPPEGVGAASQPPPTTPAFQPLPVPAGPKISLSLKQIIPKLPPSIATAQPKNLRGDATFSVPVAKVIDQLPFGCVRVSFAELFSWTTPKVLTFCAGQEEALIELPLAEVLKQLGAGQLVRRENQKQIEVSDDIENLFGPKGKPVKPVIPSSKGSASTPVPPQSERAAAPAESTPPPTVVKEVVAQKPPLTPPKPSVAPQQEAAPAPPEKPAEIITPEKAPEAPLKPSFSLPSPESLRPPSAPKAQEKPAAKPPQAAPVSAPAQKAAASPEKKIESAAQGFIQVPLANILSAASAGLKGLCEGLDPGCFGVSFDASEVEAALKKGKFLIPGNKLARQIAPSIPEAIAARFGTEPLEVPLAAVVPIFMASKRPATQQKRLEAKDDIPELFPTRKTPPTPAQTPAAPAPQAQPVAVAAPAQPVAVAAPVKKQVTAEDIVGALACLKGIQGALVTMEDGFVVASRLPVGFNTEFVSAFVPGAYQRSIELLKALNFEETAHVQLLHEGVQIHMVPAKTLFLLVFSNPGASISSEVLSEHVGLLAKCATSN